MYCDLEHASVYYEVHGEGRPILMIHGFTPDHRLMKGPMEPLFADRPGWKRIYFDLPGMGNTRADTGVDTSDKMLQTVLAFVDQVIPGERFVVAGSSYGGYLARGLAYLRPDQVSGMFLLCPVIVPAADHRARPDHVVLLKDPALLASLSPQDAEDFDSTAVVQSPAIWVRYRDEILSGVRGSRQEQLGRLQANSYAFSFDLDMPGRRFAYPALILVGRQDASVGYRDSWSVYENYPRGSFVVLDRAGHNLHIEQVPLFNALVSEWLDRLEEAKPR